MLVWYAVVDGIDLQHRVLRKVHLRDEPRGYSRAEEREVNMCRSPGIVVVSPWIAAGPDGHKAKPAEVVGKGIPFATEVRVERRMMLVPTMRVAASCIGLPHFNKRVAERAFIFVKDAAAHRDALPLSFTIRSQREIASGISEPVAAKLGSGDFR